MSEQQGTPIAFADVAVGHMIRAELRYSSGTLVVVEGVVTQTMDFGFNKGDFGIGGSGEEADVAIGRRRPWKLTLLSHPPQWRKLSSPRKADVGKRYQVELRGGRKVTGTLTCWMYDSATNLHTLTVAGEGVLLPDVVAMWEEVTQ